MDLGLSENRLTSFRMFQQRIIDQYHAMIDEFDLVVVDGTRPVEFQQKTIREMVTKILTGWSGIKKPINGLNYSGTQLPAEKEVEE